MIVSPLLILSGDLLSTRGPTDQRDLLAAIADHSELDAAGVLLAVYGFALMMPAVIGIVHLLRHRAVALGHVGGALVILGFVSFAAITGTELVNVPAADPAANRDEMLALNERLGAGLAYNLINLTEVFGYFFGFVILAIALFRANVVTRLVPALLVVSVVLRFIPGASLAIVALSDALFFAALAYIGVVVFRQSDTEWERPPERRRACIESS